MSGYVYNLKTGMATVLRQGEIEFGNPDLRAISERMFIAINQGVVKRDDVNAFFVLASMNSNPNANPDVLLKKKEVEVKDVKDAPVASLPEPEKTKTPAGTDDEALPQSESTDDVDFGEVLEKLRISGARGLNLMNVAMLRELADRLGVDISEAVRKQDIIMLIVEKIERVKNSTGG